MCDKTIQEILCQVEQPSRYLGSEVNIIKKDLTDVKLKMVLAFPDMYDIGTSHFGMQILYHVLNSHPEIAAERVFAPAPDMEKRLRDHHLPLFSLESGKDLASFDIIGFSLLYELNYTNILTILDLCHVPFLAAERDDTSPLVVAGGPCTFNPEPVADLFDAMVVGDGEEVVIKMAETYMAWKEEGGDKKELLKRWSRLDGVYVPSFYQASFEPFKGSEFLFQKLTPLFPDQERVRKAVISELEEESFPHAPVVPFGRPVHDRLRLEISRGCSRGCRFCQAGMIYRPVRERKVDDLLAVTEKSIATTGYEDVSLLSLSTGDYENLDSLMQALITGRFGDQCENSRVSVSLPSIRAGRLTPELMKIIKTVKKTGFTIAPEAGTQRLRDVINKGITEEDIFNTVQSAFELGWKNIKLYFMIGLPTETDEDLQGIVDLVHKIKKIRGKRANINVSVSTFIPKPHSVFQWERQISTEESWEKISWLRDKLKIPGVTFKWGNTNISFLEGIWSRGDRRLTPLLINAYGKGCRFDGWNEYFDLDKWQAALAEEKIDHRFYTERNREVGEPLPWSHIDSGVSVDFLLKELEKSRKEALTEDCRYGKCGTCGVCDFKTIKPRILEKEPAVETIPAVAAAEPEYKKVKVVYSKRGPARFFGHLEMVNFFIKALRRSEIKVKFSKGFNPKPRITFADPIPLGMESLEEFFIIEVPAHLSCDKIMTALNGQMTPGIEIKACHIHSGGKKGESEFRYRVTLSTGRFSGEMLEAYHHAGEFFIEKINKKGKVKRMNIKEHVNTLDLIDPSTLEISIRSVNGNVVRPDVAVKNIFELADTDIKLAAIVKLHRVVPEIT